MSNENPLSQGEIVERRLHFRPSQGQLVAPDRERQDGFIKGPLPLVWMTKAAQMPGKTLQVALALWYLCGLQKTNSVKLTTKTSSLFGLSRDAKYDALSRLEAAGLIEVLRLPGCSPVVTLLR